MITFDLFGTLLQVDSPSDPAAAVATELQNHGVPVPSDWPVAYGEHHIDAPSEAEIPLTEHVQSALSSRGIDPEEYNPPTVQSAILAAFDSSVETPGGAREAVTAAADRGPVGVLSNCSVRGLIGRSIARSELNENVFEAIVTSVDCGWRKPHPRAFRTAADALGGAVSDLQHVGDNPDTDGGVEDAGGTAILLTDRTLNEIAAGLREGRWE